MTILQDKEPRLVWKHFEEISKIPRCSKHEEKIRGYVIDFARKQGLKYKTDKAGNIVVTKPALSKNMENKPILILQSHMDMVCEKNSDVDHDFSKDPLKLKLDGDTLSADGTTLGADDGIGVSIALAMLEDKNIRNGPIEALFTVDEETGLTGAFAIRSDFLEGRTMINLDSEEFGVLTVGCAGGGESRIELPLKYKIIPKNTPGLNIKITGLKGGHSGVNIKEQRGNAIKILTRLLWRASEHYKFMLSEIYGGDKHNAIPREAFATVAINKKEIEDFSSFLKREMNDIAEEIKPIDPDCTMLIEPNSKIKKVYDTSLQDKLLLLLYSLPHGVIKMSYDIPGLVETSTNLAVVSIKGKKIQILMSSRSAVKTELDDIRARIRAIAKLAKADVTEDKPYPGWKPNMNSKLLALCRKVYKEMYKEEVKVEAVHAGLECGIIGEKFPGMDMISIGPTIRYLHSPNEQVSISSVKKLYDYTVRIAESL
ncbi:MAG: aminoacyl-histidine dipeptidase [Candidatus Thermoplasmatota archaeon]